MMIFCHYLLFVLGFYHKTNKKSTSNFTNSSYTPGLVAFFCAHSEGTKSDYIGLCQISFQTNRLEKKIVNLSNFVHIPSVLFAIGVLRYVSQVQCKSDNRDLCKNIAEI